MLGRHHRSVHPPVREAPMATPNIETIIRDRVTLTVDCIDRLYLNGYVPRLQTSGQIVGFLRDHLGNPVPSPALLRPLHDRFVREVAAFADAGKIPVVQFERGQRKDDIAAEHRARFTKAEGVVFIGVAQERASAFKARKLTGSEQGVLFEFSRQSVAVNHYYFYVQDREWGPGFVKVGTYLPYPVRVCLNGHEWAKQQARQVGLGFTSLDNGFLACDDPERLQAICDGLGPADVQRFFDRWQAQLPWPLTTADRTAGYRHRLSIWQLEVSRTQVFDRPVQGRHFFEAVIRENLDLGRPDRISLLFPKRITRRTPPPAHGDRAQPARRVQAHRRQAVLQRGAGAPDRDHDQRPDRLPVPQSTRDPPAVADDGRTDQPAPAHGRARQPRLLVEPGHSRAAPDAAPAGRPAGPGPALRRPARPGTPPGPLPLRAAPGRLPQPRAAPARRGPA